MPRGFLDQLRSFTHEATDVEPVSLRISSRLSVEQQKLQSLSFLAAVTRTFGEVQYNFRYLGSIRELLANAFDASGPHSVVEITATTKKGPNGKRMLVTTVTDSGTGFPGEMLQPGFFTSAMISPKISVHKSSEIHGGRGKGLSLLQAYVNAVGGTLELANKSEGGGAVVTFSISHE